MYLNGHTQAAIAKEIGISRQMVSKDLQTIRQRWKESAIKDFDALKEQELKKIDATEREAWECYRRSQRDRQRTVTERAGTGNPDDAKPGRAKAQVTKEQADGDPRFLKIILECIDKRCKILGLDAPDKQELSGVVEVQGVDVKRLTDEELESLRSIALRATNAGDDTAS